MLIMSNNDHFMSYRHTIPMWDTQWSHEYVHAVPDRTVMQLWSRSLTGPSLTADCRCFQSACVQTHRERTDKSNGDFNGANNTNAKGRERLVYVYTFCVSWSWNPHGKVYTSFGMQVETVHCLWNFILRVHYKILISYVALPPSL